VCLFNADVKRVMFNEIQHRSTKSRSKILWFETLDSKVTKKQSYKDLRL